MSDLKPVIEALIFASEAPLTIDKLCDILVEEERDDIRSAIVILQNECSESQRGIYLAEVAGGYQFRTKKEYADVIRKLAKSSIFRFSKAALETLAIIAYRQPITRSEIEYLRGVESGGVLKTLLEKNIIRILGKKNIPGKPLIYGTSRRFLEIFNLKDLKSLPALREISELDESGTFELQEELPLQNPEGKEERVAFTDN